MTKKTKKTKKREPNGPRAHRLDDVALNPKEYAALTVCVMLSRTRHGASNEDIAREYESGRGKARDTTQSNWWARNSVRRLIAEKLVKRVDRGSYRATPRGRKYLTIHSGGEWKMEHS